MSEKEKSIFEILGEIQSESTQWGGIIKKPEKKFNQWERDLQAWEKRMNGRMNKMDTFLTKQMRKMEDFFE
ncbi:hypothetical protein LCM20_03025 [Halobacillus litoralis]|uniref:hypothetical protein n=1 Tax=Halobacillus litoralis TaxID=45668 RepID=UPI001CD7022C|nr:hypothetical protein [Halobacillus litoralis]MCA0969563.1 hypothetical protein [Halobacillus litoralis]